ncbi:MAG: ribulose-phosphate 3-epimerase [Candidatus Eremiobacteraeota bacterium]|nr:ribulose-phosphate 3-epimerase [Candidatus Eremiobacteraeota bacterium]
MNGRNGPNAHSPRIAPSLLSADFGKVAEQMAAAESGGADLFHLDTMDGRFVPNITWGPKIVADLRKLTRKPFDAHLMIAEPERYVDQFVQAGCEYVTFHYEATSHAHRLLRHLRSIGAKAGIALNPQTPVSMLQDLIEECDLVLVMSVNPGFGGQPFIERALAKLAEARALLDERNPACELEVDGGIGVENCRRAQESGATILVAGSHVFLSDDPAEAVRAIRARISI